MCGIAGIVGFDKKPVCPIALQRMCDTMSHRGPDDAGFVFFRLGEGKQDEGGYWCEFVDPEFARQNEHLPPFGGTYFDDEMSKSSFSVGLGHRRLSIIDLSHRGHQPMSSSDRRYWVIFNGEIYNFPELRDKLLCLGHVFRTRSDTEVLLHLWEEYGEAALSQLNGMFGFALYDQRQNKLTLARDRFGVKPLYYAVSNEYLLFASEPKAILASELIDRSIRPESVVEYFTFQNIYSRNCMFEGIKLLQPGECLQFDVNRFEQPTPKSYVRTASEADPSFSNTSEIANEVAVQFGKAVERQLISDVEVGSYLSGGMDSGSIVSVAGRKLNRLLTFTCGFDLTNVNGIEQGFDERSLAEQLSFLLQTEHYDVVLHAGDMPAAMEKITWFVDDPRVGMCHQNWYVAKLASKFVKVCLAGAGGDELFGGYPWRYLKGLAADSYRSFDDAYFAYWHRLLPQGELTSLFSDNLNDFNHVPREAFDSILDNAPKPVSDLSFVDNLVHRALYFEFRTFLHGLFIMEDRISMAHSLETRVPFLDNDLADLAWKIPASLKVNSAELSKSSKETHIQSNEGKIVLRQAMETYLPKAFTQQHKQGFSPPDANWYRGPSMDYIRSILLDDAALSRPWFKSDYVRQLLSEHFDGKRNHRLLIWSLLSFEMLQRHFIDTSMKVS